jgi:hypothetical protein
MTPTATDAYKMLSLSVVLLTPFLKGILGEATPTFYPVISSYGLTRPPPLPPRSADPRHLATQWPTSRAGGVSNPLTFHFLSRAPQQITNFKTFKEPRNRFQGIDPPAYVLCQNFLTIYAG